MPVRRMPIAIAAIAGLAAAAPGAQAAPQQPVESARFGSAVAWLSPEPGASDQRTLSYRANEGEAPKVLATGLRVGRRSEDLALGTDASGRRIVIVTTRAGLELVPVSGSSVTRLPFGSPGDTAPSVLGGKVAFVRGGRRVMVSGLSRRRARVVQRATDELTAFTDTVVGAGGSVGWIRYLESEAPRMRLELLRARRAPKRVFELRTDLTAEGSLTVAGLSADGRQVTADAERGEEHQLKVFTLPGGRPAEG